MYIKNLKIHFPPEFLISASHPAKLLTDHISGFFAADIISRQHKEKIIRIKTVIGTTGASAKNSAVFRQLALIITHRNTAATGKVIRTGRSAITSASFVFSRHRMALGKYSITNHLAKPAAASDRRTYRPTTQHSGATYPACLAATTAAHGEKRP